MQSCTINVCPQNKCPLLIDVLFFYVCSVDHEVAGKDVVFLLDGSDNTRNGFAAMRDFVQRMVEQLNVGENNDRVSVVQYGRDADAHFYLNTYTTKDDILDTVRGLRHRGGRPLNTGSALKYVRDNVFTAASGSRRQEGIPQLLIVLSGGRSSDNVDIPASALKENGVLILGIGTRNSSTEVQRIASDPSYAQSVSDFSDLPNVQHPFASSLSHVVVGVKPMTPTVRGKTLLLISTQIMLYLLVPSCMYCQHKGQCLHAAFNFSINVLFFTFSQLTRELQNGMWYFFWMALMAQGMDSLPCVILFTRWWRN